MPDGEARVVEKRGVIRRNAGPPIWQLSVSESIEDAFGIEAKHRPSREIACTGNAFVTHRIQDAGLEPQ